MKLTGLSRESFAAPHDEEDWVVECNSCGAKEYSTWDDALNNGCPLCGSGNFSIYHRSVEDE